MTLDKVWEGRVFQVGQLGTYTGENGIIGAKIRVQSGGLVAEGVLKSWEGGVPSETGLCFDNTTLWADKEGVITVLEVPEVVEPKGQMAVVQVGEGRGVQNYVKMGSDWHCISFVCSWRILCMDAVGPIKVLFEGVSEQ